MVFSLLIVVHELGHFFAAKLNGIKVNEFALGMGPKLLKFHIGKGETEYTLRLFPIGGMCAMEGEDEQSGDSRAFSQKKVWQRITVVIAGPVMNILIGFVLVFLMLLPEPGFASTTVREFDANSSIEATGLQVGDTVVAVNGSKVYVDSDFTFQVLRDSDGIVDLTVMREGQKTELTNVNFVKTDGEGNSGVAFDFRVEAISKTPWTMIKQTTLKTVSIVKMVVCSVFDLVTGRYGISDLSGPVGTASAIGQSAMMGWSSFLSMLCFITINLGVFNLLPIPALDGSRLIFLLIEGIRRKPIKPEHEAYVHFVGFVLLMLLMVVVTFHDITRLFA